jgi:hypothetical protein
VYGGNRPKTLRNTAARLTGRRPVSLLFAFIIAAATAPGCNRSSSDTVPDSLLGVWTTPDSRYADRFFELRAQSVTFGLGENGRAVLPVSSVEWNSDYGKSLFTVHYQGEDGSETSMEFYHLPLDGVLVFKNQLQTYWLRKRS